MSSTYESTLAKKLNLKSGMSLRVVAPPADVDLSGLPASQEGATDAALVFVRTLDEIADRAHALLEVTAQGGVAWMAYPKAKQLGTDLNRDILWKHMVRYGLQPVRQIAIDDTWSALRFKKAS